MTYMLIRFMAHSLEKMFSSRFKPFTKSTGPLKSFINKGRDIQVLKWSWRHVKRSFPLGKKQNKRKLHKTKVWKLDSRFYRAHRHSISYLHFPHFALDMEEPVGVHKLMTPAEETKKKTEHLKCIWIMEKDEREVISLSGHHFDINSFTSTSHLFPFATKWLSGPLDRYCMLEQEQITTKKYRKRGIWSSWPDLGTAGID